MVFRGCRCIGLVAVQKNKIRLFKFGEQVKVDPVLHAATAPDGNNVDMQLFKSMIDQPAALYIAALWCIALASSIPSTSSSAREVENNGVKVLSGLIPRSIAICR